MAANKSDKLKKDYESKKVSAGRFCSALVEQIKELTYQEQISLAVPIESRVKSWSSISEKIERINLKLEDILQLGDFVGIRLILLFKRDLDRCRRLIEEKLEIIDKEDTASRLDVSQFGYQSNHYVIKLPKEWLSIPTVKELKPETQDEKLNVDILKKILDTHLPPENRTDDEDYSYLIKKLSSLGITTASGLIGLINEHLQGALDAEKELVEYVVSEYRQEDGEEDEDVNRAVKYGVMFSHTGIVCFMINCEIDERKLEGMNHLEIL